MTDSESGPGVRLVAAAAFVAGPGTAVLHETGILSLGPAATLWPIGFVVIAALAGCYTGLRITSRVSRGLGALVAIPNLLILGFYAFLLLFFGLGGSR